MRIPWKHILILGVALGLVTFVLSVTKYRLLILHQSIEAYAIVVAALFLALGLWFGTKLRGRTRPSASGQPLTGRELVERGELSEREAEVLTMMAQGLTNQEIAERLFVSVNTVKTHTSNIFSKLNVKRRMQAVQRATELGLLTQVGENEGGEH